MVDSSCSSPILPRNISRYGLYRRVAYVALIYALQSLKQSGAVFRILFIDENSATWSGQPSKLLARELLQRHLELNTDFEVDRIKSWTDGSADSDGVCAACSRCLLLWVTSPFDRRDRVHR